MIRSHLHFKPGFTFRDSKCFSKKLPPVGIEHTTLTITGSKVECLSKKATETCASRPLTEACFMHHFTFWTLIPLVTLGAMEFSLNGAELSLNSVNSENLRNHWSMNWVQYKDLLCYLCLCGLVVSSLSLTQENLGSSPTLLFFFILFFFCHWIQRIKWKHLEETPVEFFMIRSHLHFKPGFRLRDSKCFSKKLPPVGIEPTTPTITGSKVECLSKKATETCAGRPLTEVYFMHHFTFWTLIISRIIKACLM